MANIKTIGIGFDRTFRNDLNGNFQALNGETKAVQQQINNIVIESGTSDAEVLQARGESATLNDRLTGVDAQLAEKATKGEIVSADLKTLNESDRLGLVNLKEEVIQAMAGTTPVNSIPADASVTPIKTSFMSISENIIDPAKRNDGKRLGFTYNVDTESTYVTDAALTSYTETFTTVSGEVVYSNTPGRLVWYNGSGVVQGNAGLVLDAATGLYKATVGGGVKSKIDGYLSYINLESYWFVCKSASYSGGKSKFGATKLNDNVESNTLAKKVELDTVKSDVSALKTPTANATFFAPHYLYCYESNKGSKWIPKYNVMTAKNYNDFYIDITAGWGYFRDWERVLTQASDTVKIKNVRSGAEVYSKGYTRRSVNPASKTNPATAKNVLVIGDSFSDAGFIPCDIKKQLSDNGFSNFNFIGTKSDTINSVTALNEGRGGYTLDDFLKTDNTGGRGATYPNPFMSNGVVSFSDYMTRNAFAGSLDHVIIELGVNNIVAFTHTPDAIKTKMQSLIDLILASYPSCKIFVCGLVMISKINGTTDCHYHNSLVLNINKAYEELCESTGYAANCVYVDTSVFFDTDYGFPVLTTPYRGSTEQRKVQTDWLHPSEAGYYMMSDTIASAFIYHM